MNLLNLLGLITLSLATLASFDAGAQSLPESETFYIERSFQPKIDMVVELNDQTVRCLVGDYGASSLKISLPELKHLTVFNHTTRGETEPCINAGACKFPDEIGGLAPKLIIDPKKPTEQISVSIRLVEGLTLNHVQKTCDSYLTETVESVVRGLPFMHVVHKYVGTIGYDKCLKLKN